MVTIYEALRIKLGRNPTHEEQCAEVARIIREASEDARARKAVRS